MEVLPLPDEIMTTKSKNQSVTIKKKILMIDGLSSIMNEEYFLSDTIPRYLIRFIEEGYNVWIIVREQENTDSWNLLTVPDFLRENILIMNDFDKSNLVVLANQESSMVITNYPENQSLYGICGKVHSSQEIFNLQTYPKLTIADFLFCFGFTETQFFAFCEESNLIGIIENKTIRDKDEKNKTNGMTFWVNPNKEWEEQMKEFNEFANICIQRNLFIPKHQKTLLGIIYQGKGKFLALKSKLPLLYI